MCVRKMTGTFNVGACRTIRALPSSSVYLPPKPNSVAIDPPSRSSVPKLGRKIPISSRCCGRDYCCPLRGGHALLDKHMATSVPGCGHAAARPAAKIPKASPEFRSSGRLIGLAVRKSSESSSKVEESASLPTSEGDSVVQTSDELERRQVERLFSNLNEGTLKHEPGTSSHCSLLGEIM